jgi:hypothetical protein
MQKLSRVIGPLLSLRLCASGVAGFRHQSQETRWAHHSHQPFVMPYAGSTCRAALAEWWRLQADADEDGGLSPAWACHGEAQA